MTSPSSFNVTGLLGGTAGQLDTTQLVSQLVQAAALPQTNLKNALAVQQAIVTAYQGVSAKVSAMQTAAQALTDPLAWQATAATSSSSSVVASSTSSALPGATTFDVTKLASAQISTVAADGSGDVVSVPANGITITDSGGTAHQIVPASGSAVDVAAAINNANAGVRVSVVNTDSGTVLQLTATSTGTAGAFTAAGFSAAPQSVTAAQNAQISVGTGPGAYTVSSATNTFTNVINGVTFTVSALASNVTVSVASDETAISNQVKALVDAANATASQVSSATGQGAILEGNLDLQTLQQQLSRSVSNGTATGGTLSTYGIDIDKTGVLSFNAATFAQAWASDPAGTKSAISGAFAKALDTSATQAIDPVTGSITAAVKTANNQETSLNTQITAWTSRLADIQTMYQNKFNAMETALARLQSQQTYLNSMINSMNRSSSSSSGN